MREERKRQVTKLHRRNITVAAERLFSARGTAAVTVDDIAREAGYSKSTLYVYFTGKEDIYGHILLSGMRELKARLLQALDGGEGFTARYYRVCAALTDFQREKPLHFDGLLGGIPTDLSAPGTPSVFGEVYEAGEEINAAVGAFLSDGIAAGDVRGDVLVPQTGFLFWTALSGLIGSAAKKRAYVESGLGMSYEAYLKYGFDLLLRAVVREGAV